MTTIDRIRLVGWWALLIVNSTYGLFALSVAGLPPEWMIRSFALSFFFVRSTRPANFKPALSVADGLLEATS